MTCARADAMACAHVDAVALSVPVLRIVVALQADTGNARTRMQLRSRLQHEVPVALARHTYSHMVGKAKVP